MFWIIGLLVVALVILAVVLHLVVKPMQAHSHILKTIYTSFAHYPPVLTGGLKAKGDRRDYFLGSQALEVRYSTLQDESVSEVLYLSLRDDRSKTLIATFVNGNLISAQLDQTAITQKLSPDERASLRELCDATWKAITTASVDDTL